MQTRDTMATALIWSCALHLLVGLAAHRWWLAPPPREDAVASTTMSLSLVPASIPAATATAPSTPQREADPAHPKTAAHQAAPRELAEVAAAVLPAINLNPVPQLSEPFELQPATLAFRQPMAPQQRLALQAALNQVAAKLPAWTDGSTSRQWRDGEREYTLERQPPADATSLERAVLRVTTVENGLALEAEVPVTRMAFSHFAQVVDRWNPEVDLAGDRIIGRFHSNSPLYVSARAGAAPSITGPTTVAGTVIIEGRGRRADIFTRGLETRARRMRLPRQPVDPEAFRQGERVHLVEESGRLVFLADGGYHWLPAAGGATPRHIMPGGYPWLVHAADGVELEVEGDVKGSLLVYSPERISITGPLRYAHDPRREASPDFLGLVSDANVEIAPSEVTGPGDIDVHAAIFAGGQFRVRRYNSRDGGLLRVLGSVTAGTLSATEPRFKTVLEFDQRLEEQRPAHFPMTNRYRLDEGELLWTVASGS
ncbi:MAG: hypothetical protein V2I66_02720 [Halieaceae bacterium]|jgi:hypothetical protein|nr:hypothetical protein [Halieaceae bacterium]